MRLFIEELGRYIDQGGLVMWPLILLTFALWYALGYRFLLLSRDRSVGARAVVQAIQRTPKWKPKGIVDEVAARIYAVRGKYPGNIRRFLEYVIAPHEDKVGTLSTLVKTIVVVAPLAGLLGTVTGMIEMFDSLADQTFFSQSGGVANGISQALITTQLGLAIAIPGLILGRLLDRKERRIRGDLMQLIELFSEEGEKSL